MDIFLKYHVATLKHPLYIIVNNIKCVFAITYLGEVPEKAKKMMLKNKIIFNLVPISAHNFEDLRF